MQGYIKSVNNSTKTGVVEGNNGNKYKFYFSDFRNGEFPKPGDFISFKELTPTTATKCHIKNRNSNTIYKSNIHSGGEVKYVTPNEVFWSKESGVKGWETIESCDWTITASGRGDPADVRDELKRYASFLGANAVIHATYDKSTGSEAGTGRGTHYYTIHHYYGKPIIIGKRNNNGVSRHKLYKNLNETARQLKIKYNEEYRKSKKNHFIAGSISFLGTALIYFGMDNVLLSLVAGIVSFGIMFSATDNGAWLNK